MMKKKKTKQKTETNNLGTKTHPGERVVKEETVQETLSQVRSVGSFGISESSISRGRKIGTEFALNSI